MAKYLFTVWPFAGHLHPSLAIAHALRARGHEVAFYTGTAARSVVEEEGFQFFPFQRLNEDRATALASSEFPFSPSAWQRLRSAKQTQAKFREWLLDTIPDQIRDIDEVLASWRPNVLVCDLALWSPFLVLHEIREIPVAVLSVLASCILPGPDAPMWGQGWARPRNPVMRLVSGIQRRLLYLLSAGFRSDVNEIRRRYGLPAICCTVTEYAGEMPLYLVPSAPEYDYSRQDLPASVHYVGPCLWDKSQGAPSPEWLTELPSDRPLIYVTEASIGTSEPFLLKTAAEALQDQPLNVVMTTGRQRNPEDLGLLLKASNMRIESYIPQSDLLPKTSVMVTLGGSGGVLASLRAGVPLVVVPTEWDRPENAQRVVEAGAGIRIPPGECTPERLREAVFRVLNDPTFRRNAQRISSAFAKLEGSLGAAKLLEILHSRECERKNPRKTVWKRLSA